MEESQGERQTDGQAYPVFLGLSPGGRGRVHGSLIRRVSKNSGGFNAEAPCSLLKKPPSATLLQEGIALGEGKGLGCSEHSCSAQ